LTIGSRCRPLDDRKLYRWAHIITPGDGVDGVTPDVTPGHMRNPHWASGIKINGEGVFGPNELDYCVIVRDHQDGSCMFRDNVPRQNYRRTDGTGTTLTTDPNGHASAWFSRTSTATDASVVPAPESPPTISGTFTLTAAPGDWTPAVSDFTYQWCRIPAGEDAGCEPIDGATQSTYAVQPVDVGAQIEVIVSPDGHPETGAWSDPEFISTDPRAPQAMVAPSVSHCGWPWAVEPWTPCMALPGTWTGDPDLTFIPRYCSDIGQEPCRQDEETAEPNAYWEMIWRSGCRDESWVITVVARNAYGTVFYPVRGQVWLVCDV
jgi:hypothetical protein